MIRDLGDWQGKVNNMLFFGDMALLYTLNELF